MNRLNVIALAVGLAFSAGAIAQNVSKEDYKAGKDRIATEYKSAKAGCGSLSGNTKDICMAEAKGNQKVAKAELEASYKPSLKTQYQARIARADAGYAVASERCDDLAGNVKDVCVQEAKAAKTSAKADAKAQMKVAEANATAAEKSSSARGEANSKSVEARKDATTDKFEAEYKVAKEKCDTYSGDAKDNCLSQAKVRFGQS